MNLWHPIVHERVLGESLAYFQLSFVPVYKRGAAIRRQVLTLDKIRATAEVWNYGQTSSNRILRSVLSHH